MSTPFDIFGVTAPTGSKLVAALYMPYGSVTPVGVTINGGTVTGTPTVPTGDPAIYLGLSESPAGSGQYGGNATLAGATLNSSTTRPYTVEVRIVAGGTDMTSYTAIAAAFAASTSVAYTRDVPPTLVNGMLLSGQWGNTDTINAIYDKIGSPAVDLLTDLTANIPAAVLATPANKLATDGTGKVTTANPSVTRNITVIQS